ncbi:MAG: alpha/beta fold hydrolase, partial [Paracoccaceae bacterium]|nr:alpha/beta fold hydrolase [Paracoccaceae bacterium]
MSRWLVDWPARVAPLASLLCFPGAGAGASVFRGWAEGLPPYVSVSSAQLPGREERIDEQPAENLPAVADAIAGEWLARRALPTVIFGHSMGAVLGYEVAQRLSQAGRPATALVFSASA